MPDACMGISAENVTITADPNDNYNVHGEMDFRALTGTGCVVNSVSFQNIQGTGLSMSSTKYGDSRIVARGTEKTAWNGHLTKVKATFTGTEADGSTATFVCNFRLQSC